MTGLRTPRDHDRLLHRDWGERIRQARLHAGIDQAGLAEQLGIYQQLVSRWENGKAAPHDHLRPRVAKALGVEVDELFPYPDVDAEVPA